MEDRSPARLRNAYSQALAALRAGRAATAERELRAIQAAAPGEINSLRLLGTALLAQDKALEAIPLLERAVTSAPAFAQARVDLARAYRSVGRLETAREEARRVVATTPGLDTAWLAYGDVLVDLEKYPDAKFAYDKARQCDPARIRIELATAELVAENRTAAESIFREILREDASHVASLCGLAAIALGAGNPRDAERLLRHASKQTAHLPLISRGLGQTLLESKRLSEAETVAREILKIEPENPQNWIVLGSIYARLLKQQEALVAFEEAARLSPASVTLRLSIGHILKTLGRRTACEAAYHECLRMDPTFGAAYWSLADLKTYTFSEVELAAMQTLIENSAEDDADQAQLRFALGRAFEQKADYDAAFLHYAAGNALRRRTSPFDMAKFEDKSRRVRARFDRAFFAGVAAADRSESNELDDGAPIFIVGLPRSGSTLVEQILASHTNVEGTMELPHILTLVREFDARDGGDGYPEGVLAMTPDGLRALGARYLEQTRPIRTGRPRFIDKMPNNFSHVGLIHAILPRATIIDVRRHPMDSCFSTFKQHFAEGQSFSYDLDDLGRYYRCYLELMDHWDAVLPGKVLQLSYEDLVAEPERHIRALLVHCGLPFEETCLNFHETQRPIRTASSEQVRRPIYASGVGYWRLFARHLEPLRRSLGDCLARFESADRA